ncbi:MAG: hypothetical protein ACXWN4_00675 [Candidatus Limnocylindrales bacterium]
MFGTLLRLAGIRRESSRDVDPRLVAFTRGVAMGALLGAAIAGSTLWSRRRRTG